jgi:hypothetical protein
MYNAGSFVELSMESRYLVLSKVRSDGTPEACNHHRYQEKIKEETVYYDLLFPAPETPFHHYQSHANHPTYPPFL